MKSKIPKLFNNLQICFIYGFADIQNDSEILDWQKQINELKKTNNKAIIVVMRESSNGFQKMSESAHLCLKLSEEKYKSITSRNQFIKVLDNYLVKPFTGNGIWDIKSMSEDNNSFDFVSEMISIVEFENSPVGIVRSTIERMIQSIHQPKDMLFLIVFSDETYKSASQICKIVNELDKKGNSYHALGAARKNYLEISLLGTNFEF